MHHNEIAPGRLAGTPVAVIDIGSNSVRLVAYETLSRALTPLFNEKVLCGLGRGVATGGLLADDAMGKAVAALGTFRLLCRQMAITDVTVIATAAIRDAGNGPAFLARAREAVGADITLVAGSREAELAALGVRSGIHRPDGVVGDLGGGSLELIDLVGDRVGTGHTLPLGSLALSDLSRGSPRRAVRLVRDMLVELPVVAALPGRTFFAVGGTWRSLAKLHMRRRRYPLHVVQGYELPADPDLFADLLEEAPEGSLAGVATSRRPLLAFGAVVLAELVRLGRPARIVLSTFGVREGLLFERLPADEREADPLLAAARDFNLLRARSPAHADDLIAWTDQLFASAGLVEDEDGRRLRQAACLLADVAWRAHPDYRGVQAFATIANGAFAGLGHAGRAFLARAMQLRYEGLDTALDPAFGSILGPAEIERAQILAAALRVAFQLTAAMGGVLEPMPLVASETTLTLRLPPAMAPLASARVQSRLKQLARLVGRESAITVG